MNAYIVADQRWAFGRNGGLLFSLPTDLEHFHNLTRHGTVIMGPERLRFFGGDPLPQRRNILITRDLSMVPEGAEAAPTPEEALLRQERKKAVSRALDRLSSQDRLLFYRKYYYMQSNAQIASELGLTERAVEGRLYRLRKQLRKMLGGDGYA